MVEKVILFCRRPALRKRYITLPSPEALGRDLPERSFESSSLKLSVERVRAFPRSISLDFSPDFFFLTITPLAWGVDRHLSTDSVFPFVGKKHRGPYSPFEDTRTSFQGLPDPSPLVSDFSGCPQLGRNVSILFATGEHAPL